MINVYLKTKNFNKEVFLEKFNYLGEFNFDPQEKKTFPLIEISSSQWENKNFSRMKNSFFLAGLEGDSDQLININSKGETVLIGEGFNESLFYLGIKYLRSENEEALVNFGLNSKFENKCLFLDRDGILNIDSGYVKNINEIKIIDEAVPLILWANQNNYLVIVLTNQSGVARGILSFEQAHEINEYLKKEFQQRGGIINDFFICPYHIDGEVKKFSINSIYRKPAPGMLVEAIEKYDIDPCQSYMVGDKSSDKFNFFDCVETFFLEGAYPLVSKNNVFSTHGEILQRLMLK